MVGYASGELHLFCSDDGKVTNITRPIVIYRDLISTVLQTYCDSIGVSGGEGAVESIVYDAIHDRIACICGKSTQLFRIKGNDLDPILKSPLMSKGYGKCIHFCDDGASVVMSYLDTHEW